MSASNPSALTNDRDMASAQTRHVLKSNHSANGPVTEPSSLARNSESLAAEERGSRHVGIEHGQNKHSAGGKDQGIDPKSSKEVNAAGVSDSDGRPDRHKRRKALASIAALVIGLASLGLRIAECVGG